MFEKGDTYYEKYLCNIGQNLLPFREKKLEEQKDICKEYINNINSRTI